MTVIEKGKTIQLSLLCSYTVFFQVAKTVNLVKEKVSVFI